MDIEPTIDSQLLAHAKRQTKALETISLILTTASVVLLVALFIYLINANMG